jgi:hypothetical protein
MELIFVKNPTHMLELGERRFITSESLKPLVCVPKQGGRPVRTQDRGS